VGVILKAPAVRSLPCSVKAHVGMEPHAKTPPPPVLFPKVTATQALELLGSVSARTRVSEFMTGNFLLDVYQHHNHKH